MFDPAFSFPPCHANRPLNDSGDDPPSRFASGILLAVVGTFLFALKSIFIKLAFAAGAEPTMLLVIRLAFALPFYVGVLWQVHCDPATRPIGRPLVMRAIGMGFLGYYLASYLDLSGLQYITAQLERLTLFVYPAIVAILAWLFLGERLHRRIILSIVLCYCGVAIMYGQERLVADGTQVTWGVVLVSGAAVSYAVYILLAKPTMAVMGSRRFTSLAMIGSTGFIGLHFLATREVSQLITASPVVYAYGFVLAIVCTLIPSFMINEAIMRVGATRTAVIGSVGPVLTMLLAIGVLGEPSSPWHFVGMGTAIVGVGLVTRK